MMCSHHAETESSQTLERRVAVAAAKRTQGMCQGLMSLGTMAVVGPIISIPTVCFMTGKESRELMCARKPLPLPMVLRTKFMGRKSLTSCSGRWQGIIFL